MSTPASRSLGALGAALGQLVLLPWMVLAQAAPAVPASAFEPLEWRGLGPVVGGRSIAVAGSVRRPNEYYFGATGGGLWKTTNGGTDWFPVTDGQIRSASVGAVAVCESDPDVVYIGTGEVQFRGTMSMGDGVYRSTDGGRTWSHLGLESSTGQTAVGRVRIHPRNCDHVYAAVLGDPWGPNPERGVYRSTDGGRSWSRVLHRSDRAGAVDLVMDPADPATLYASTWEVRRRPWEANSGGPGSGLFRSTDGGDTWTELTANPGLPRGRIGKIGITVSAADRQRLYAVIEHEQGGVFRSDDGGATWSLASGNLILYERSEYYNRIYADPGDRETVYVLVGNGFFRSRDGGETYEDIDVPHGDNHDLWIDPTNPLRLIQSNDGGANVSLDGAATWTQQDYSTAQMYHVVTTNDFPFHVCGGQQDGSSKCLPVDGDGTYYYESAAGEQGYIAVDPRNTDLQWGGAQRGYVARLDRSTGQRKNVEAWPDFPQGLPPGQIPERFQWTFPIVLSPVDPDVLFVASQHVWRSENGGDSWTRISPDLTYADPATLEGEKSIIPNQNSQDYYATIFSLAPSPHDVDVIWAGSDDGMVHVTRDGGESWQNVTPPDLPKFSRVSLIEASPHRPGKAYLAVERYKMQDVAPYVFRTEDYGGSWRRIETGILPGHYVRAVKEDPEREGLLFAGTEHAPYVSFDDGAHWQSLALGLPDLQVSDLEVRGDALVISTYGRGFFVLDDISYLRELRPEVLARDVHLFRPGDVVRTRARPLAPYRRVRLPGANRVNVFYHLKAPAQRVALEFLDASGTLVRRFDSADPPRPVVRDNVGQWINGPPAGWSRPAPPVGTGAGLQEFAWDLRHPPATEFEGLWLSSGSADGPQVVPGTYQVRLVVDGESFTQTFTVLKDPRLTRVTQADLEAQGDLERRIHGRLNDALTAVARIRSLREQVQERAYRAGVPEARESAERTAARLTEIEQSLYQTRLTSPSGALVHGIRLTNKLSALLGHVVMSADGPPTRQSYEVFEELSRRLDQQLSALETLVSTEVGDVAR